MSDRCEPPEELRGVDGWHWLHHPGWGEWPARYSAPCHAGVWPIWQCPDSNWTTPAAHREGWRYLAPVTPPAEVDALRAEASEWCQKAQLFEDRITRLRAELAAAREALKDAAAHLFGAAAAYRKYGRQHKVRGPADPFYTTRANDFDRAAERASGHARAPARPPLETPHDQHQQGDHHSEH